MKGLPFFGSLPRCPQQLESGQAKARSQTLPWASHVAGRHQSVSNSAPEQEAGLEPSMTCECNKWHLKL